MWKSRYTFFSFVTWRRNQKDTWLWSWSSSNVSYQSANFGDHRFCGRGDIRLYICSVTTWLKGHVTWWILSPCHHPLSGRCHISNSNANFNFNVYKLPTFSLSHMHLIRYKLKPRFQFWSLYFVDHMFNNWLFGWIKTRQFIR